MKLKLSAFLGLLLTGLSLPFFQAPVHAEGLTCMGDYYSFIFTVRSEASRSESLEDIFKLGFCQLNDIMSLDDELDSVRENLRTAANACNATSSYKTEYQRILMEMYFVRHLQEEGVLDAVDEKVLESLKDEKLANLKSEMIKIFVDGEKRLDGETFNTYYETWSAKYDDRIADYRGCKEGPWADLITTWTDFTATIQEIADTVKDFPASIDTSGGKSMKDIFLPDMGDAAEEMTEMGNSINEAWQYLKGEKEKNKAAIEDPQTVAQTGSGGGSITVDQALKSLNASFKDYNLIDRSTTRMSEYAILYGAGGSVQSTNLQSIMTELNSVLETMNNKDLPTIAVGAAKVSDKQCK